MKRFAQLALVASLVAGLSLFVAGCGKEEEKKTGASGDTPIANTTQGTQAASSTSQNVDTAMNSGQTFDNLGSIGLSSTVGAPGFKAGEILTAPTATSFEKACSTSGSYTFNGTLDPAGTSTGDFVFTNCLRDDGATYNGPMHLEGTISLTGINLNMTLGSNGQMTITNADGRVSTMSNFSLILTTGITSSSQKNRTIKASGTMTVQNGDKTVTTTFSNNFTQTVVDNMSAGQGTKSITTSGTVSEAGPSRTVTTSFSNFTIDITTTTDSQDVSINGTFTIASGSCFDGTFSLVTNTPIKIQKATGQTVAGQIVVNSATTMTFKADGSVDVTTAGQTTTYTSIDDVDVCPL